MVELNDMALQMGTVFQTREEEQQPRTAVESRMAPASPPVLKVQTAISQGGCKGSGISGDSLVSLKPGDGRTPREGSLDCQHRVEFGGQAGSRTRAGRTV